MSKPQSSPPKLNKSQSQAVEHGQGPLLVVAGAGTGKTRVIVDRIVRLIDDRVEPESILALTFTEKAAQEMLDRVEESRGNLSTDTTIKTFNGFGHELLREFGIEIGLGVLPRLVGDIGKVVLLRENLDDLELDYFAPISSPESQLEAIANYFSSLKQQLVRPEEYKKYADKLPEGDSAEKLEKIRHRELAKAFTEYLRICRSKNIIDYDDQIYLLVELLEQRPNVLKVLQKRYSHILVDEFQDTNPMQSRLIDLIAEKHKNLMVVGDDDQSIYGWRGATLTNILEFTKRYPKAEVVTLIKNYRSTQPILDTAYRLIQNNNPDRLEVTNKLDKKLETELDGNQEPVIKNFGSFDAELAWVAVDIKQRIKDGFDPGKIAVLARRGKGGVNRIHNALNLQDVEHIVVGVNENIYNHPIVMTMTEALKAVVDPRDNNALYHTLSGALFNHDTEILGQAVSLARKQFMSFNEALEPDKHPEIQKSLELIKQWQKKAGTTSVGHLSYRMLEETGLKDRVLESAENSEEDYRAAQALFQWFSTLKAFEEVSDISTALSYMENLETLKSEGETLNDETLLIDNGLPIVMTVHKAKGLEWDLVYIVDCTEYSFPLRKRSTSLTVPDDLVITNVADVHLAEERRLMYVAVTRAKRELILTHSVTHNGVTKRKPSRFLEEMFGEIADSEMKPVDINLELFEDEKSSLKPKTRLPASMIRGDKLVLSATEVNNYMRCPLDFKYRHILKVPQAPGPEAEVGNLFHDHVLFPINKAKISGKNLPSVTELTDYLEKHWPKEGYLSAKQRDRAVKQGLASAKAVYERVKAEPIPIAVEEPFSVHVPNSRLILKGRIDVVMPADDGVEVRDYKSGTSTDTPKRAKQKAQSSKQLEIYAMAWRIMHDEIPVRVALDYVQTDQIGTVRKMPKTIDNLEVMLAQIAEDIFAGKFEPGSDHSYCRHPHQD